MNHYITEIKIEELRHLSNISICLKEDQRTNLLLTGKNGSGKTTVLNALKKYLTVIPDQKMKNLEENWPEWMKQKKKEMETAKSENEKFDAQQMYEIYYNNIKKYRDGLLVAFNQKDGLESSFQNGQFI